MEDKVKQTQCNRLLKMLEAKANQRVSIRDIVIDGRMLQYNARVFGLRKRGYQIENKIEWAINRFGERVKHGFYKLVKND